MVLGHFKIPHKSIVLPYDDEKTPVTLMGKKMLPIVVFPDGTKMNESLDIIAKIDVDNKLKCTEILQSSEFQSFNENLNKMGKPLHSLVMPYWIYTPEFNESSRTYFQCKKEKTRGPFQQLVLQAPQLLEKLAPFIADFEAKISDYYGGNALSLYDILLASHLWGLYVLPEFQFSDKMHTYLQRVKSQCHFHYHQDFWESAWPSH